MPTRGHGDGETRGKIRQSLFAAEDTEFTENKDLKNN
jgi:hypothetical protein